jgi:outer membrane murein-binding lipoprotein Lpp
MKTTILSIVAGVFCAVALAGCTNSAKSSDETPGAVVGRPGQI